jgi:hypothetical protein
MNWVTVSALATAAGTLVLAAATFASVKSANRAARVAERALFVGLRPLLVPSRLDDPPQKVGFADRKWLHVSGGCGVADATEEFAAAREAIVARDSLTVDLLYGDLEGGQRIVSRFVLDPRQQGDGYIASVGRHWNIDRPDPR